MRYFGSKGSLAPAIHRIIAMHVPAGRLCDPFGGLGVVGSYFKKQGYAITAGDVLAFAHAFQVARIELDHLPPLHGVLAHVKLTSALDVESYLDSRKRTGSRKKNHSGCRRCTGTARSC